MPSQKVAGSARYRSEVSNLLYSLPESALSIFNSMNDEEIQGVLNKTSVIDCRKGDHIIKEGNVTQNLFVVLQGLIEVCDNGRQLETIGPGETIGEMAFLLGKPRTKDVFALTDDARILSISESVLRNMIDTQPNLTARMLLNISRL